MDLLWFFMIFEVFVAVSLASFDFCVEPEEQKKLIGIPAELCYVKDGEINEYALKTFTIAVKSSISTMHFVWQNKQLKVVARYVLNVEYQPNEAMGNWSSSLPRNGVVPDTRQGFDITLPCTGKADAETDVTISFSINREKKIPYDLKLKRRKICVKKTTEGATTETSQPHGQLSHEDAYLGAIDKRHVPPVSSSTKTIAILTTCFMVIVIVGLTVALILYRNKKKGPSNELSPLEQGAMQPPLMGVSGGMPHLGHDEDFEARDGLVFLGSPKQSLLGSHYDYGASHCDSVVHPPTALLALDEPLIHEENPHRMLEIMREFTIEEPIVEILETIQSGTFGLIQRGVLMEYNADTGEQQVSQEVRIKSVKRGLAAVSQLKVMFHEGTVFHGIQHPNINSFIALVTEQTLHMPLLLYGGAHHANLRTLLMSANRVHFLPERDLIFLGLQALDGLQCLHSHGIVHKDIAARNCILSSDLNLQLTDAALSRDLFAEDYHCLFDNNNRPVRWMPYESLENYDFSSASDVWSFGVLLWELLSFGCQPFLEVDPTEMSAHLKDGIRLSQPPTCPDRLYQQMLNCWKFSPSSRPSVAQLIQNISDFHAELANYV